MRYKYLTAFLCAAQSVAFAQQSKDTASISDPVALDQYTYSINKFKENKKNVSQSMMSLRRNEIEAASAQNTGVLLEQTGNVFVQKSQLGGGSPAMRGFEASRVLMVVDGVRMNNAIYRAGHLQNVITIDNNILDRVDVLFGPASTLYGSDALGGVIVFTTRAPQLGFNGKKMTTGNAMLRYSSAYDEQTGHFDFNIGGKKLASLTSVTYSKFGDLRQGNYRNPAYGTFGMRTQYVDRVNGMDSILKNEDPNVQKFSGYQQVDILEKILYQQNENVSHTLNLQYSTSTDIPRYDRLTDLKAGQLRYAQWYYGPQERLMAAYQLDANLPGFFDEIKAGVNYQGIEESRHQRERGKNNLQSRIENASIIGYNIDLHKTTNKHELTIGTDGQYNTINSEAHERDIVTNVETPIDTRYPDGGSTMFYGAVYAQHIFKIIPDKLILNDGIRLNSVSLNSTFQDTSFFPFPFNEASQSNIAWSGNLGLVFLPCNSWRIALNGSTGFRAPNVDDIAKVFESASGTKLVVPNPDLKPEYTYNLDLGISYVHNHWLKMEATGFYTWFKDAIIQDAFTLNGADSVVYNGNLTAVVANQNKAHAFIYGFNAGLTANLAPHVVLRSTVNFTLGRYYNQNDVEVPLDHIPPVMSRTGISYEPGHFRAEGFVMYNGWKYIKDYNPYGEDNQQYATAFGTPEWYTLNVRAGYRFAKYFAFDLALENLLDTNYRLFASGISAPGRNLVVTLRGSF